MKDRRNVLLLIGATLSAVPLVSYIIEGIAEIITYTKLIHYISAPDIRGTLFLMIANFLFITLIAILSIMQIQRNNRKNSNRTLPLLGMVVSSVCLVLTIPPVLTQIPSVIIHQSLDLISVRYIINILFVDFVIAGIVGYILLMIAYTCSLPKRKM